MKPQEGSKNAHSPLKENHALSFKLAHCMHDKFGIPVEKQRKCQISQVAKMKVRKYSNSNPIETKLGVREGHLRENEPHSHIYLTATKLKSQKS